MPRKNASNAIDPRKIRTISTRATHFDRGPLAIYCVAYAYWVEATEALQKYGTMMKSPNGYPVQSPYVAIANKQAEIMMRIASEFGFTPASRGRLGAPSPSKPTLVDFCYPPSIEGST